MKQRQPVIKRTLASWIFDGNIGLQISLSLVILITVAIRVVPLEMQKRIVNEAINLRQIELLGLYCGIYLAAVVSASLCKFIINTLQTKISEHATASMRKQLYQHILRLPLNFFRTTQPGMVVNSIVNELTLAGNFIGMSVAVPAINILTLIAFAGYLFLLNPYLAIISMSIYPIMLIVIPMVQKKVNQENKKRVDLSRHFSSKLVESISGIHEVQANGAFEIESTKFSAIVENLRKIRVRWAIFKFAVKVTNNLFTSLGPVLIFIIGGYLAIKGSLELGAMVAFLSAQEKLYDPWKELLEFYQVYQDGSVIYYKTMDYFDAGPELLLPDPQRAPLDLEAGIDVNNLTMTTEDGLVLLDNVSLSLKPGEDCALVGFSGSGKSSLVMILGQLYPYASGHALIGGHEISDLTKKDVTKHIGLVSQAPFIFSGSIKENLLYAYAALHAVDGRLEENRQPPLDDLISVLQQSGLFVDVLHFGLNTIIEDDGNDLVPVIIRMRQNFQKEFGEAAAKWVEFFNDDNYLAYSSIADNIIFGTPIDPAYANDRLVKNKLFLSFLDEADLTRPLIALGKDLAEQTVDILKNLPLEMVFFEQSPIAIEEFNDYKTIVKEIKNKKLHQIDSLARSRLLELALRFTPGRHKTAALQDFLKTMILEGRHLFREGITRNSPGSILFFETDGYIHSQTILNNILFGRTKTDGSHVQEKINQMIVQLLIEEDLLERTIEIGMTYDVGDKGNRLSGGQRQKLAIARTFLKAPPVMLLDEATSALDNRSQQRIQNVLERNWKGRSTIVSVVHRLDIVKTYDKVAFMKNGKIVEMGSFDELIEKKGYLHGLINERK